MGLVKSWMIEQEERGYSAVDGDICSDCVSDEALVRWVEANASATECRFCGREEEEPIAAPFDDFVGIVLSGIGFDWNDPNPEGIMYISAEGGYQAPLSETWEVLGEYDISDNDEVVGAICDAIETTAWVERDFYYGDDSQRLVWGWEHFKEIVKHRSRFLFLSPGVDDSEDYPASGMLGAIGKVVGEDAGHLQIIKTIPAGTELTRIRIGQVEYKNGGEIGTPPEQYATQSNRMSPAGIPMFYGAFDAETAFVETFSPQHHAGQIASTGVFKPTRDLRVLDLADLPPIPSVFDEGAREFIHPLRFLRAFAQDLVQPIAHDGREHIDYVPTQIVTEYFRHIFRCEDGGLIDGLIYTSSRRPEGRAIVLFCSNEQCTGLGILGQKVDKLLELASVTHALCAAG